MTAPDERDKKIAAYMDKRYGGICFSGRRSAEENFEAGYDSRDEEIRRLREMLGRAEQALDWAGLGIQGHENRLLYRAPTPLLINIREALAEIRGMNGEGEK